MVSVAKSLRAGRFSYFLEIDPDSLGVVGLKSPQFLKCPIVQLGMGSPGHPVIKGARKDCADPQVASGLPWSHVTVSHQQDRG